jgi:hypothetical protein
MMPGPLPSLFVKNSRSMLPLSAPMYWMLVLTAPAMRTKALPDRSVAAVNEMKPLSVIVSNSVMLPWMLAET